MNLQEIKEIPLGHHRRKRLGRGPRSGHGKTSTKGHKGRNARAGTGGFTGYEGGQTPLFRRLPKRGFNNANFRIEYAVINVGDLNGLPAGTEVSPDALLKAGIIHDMKNGLKVLGGGALDVPLKVQAHKFSASAAQKIKDAGGEVREL